MTSPQLGVLKACNVNYILTCKLLQHSIENADSKKENEKVSFMFKNQNMNSISKNNLKPIWQIYEIIHKFLYEYAPLYLEYCEK